MQTPAARDFARQIAAAAVGDARDRHFFANLILPHRLLGGNRHRFYRRDGYVDCRRWRYRRGIAVFNIIGDDLHNVFAGALEVCHHKRAVNNADIGMIVGEHITADAAGRNQRRHGSVAINNRGAAKLRADRQRRDDGYADCRRDGGVGIGGAETNGNTVARKQCAKLARMHNPVFAAVCKSEHSRRERGLGKPQILRIVAAHPLHGEQIGVVRLVGQNRKPLPRADENQRVGDGGGDGHTRLRRLRMRVVDSESDRQYQRLAAVV